ncbi:MAG: hypothetical protein IKX67_07155 [Bacteroidales bacterium]|nr:hypothetical protein [Bacteroidales bacterium]
MARKGTSQIQQDMFDAIESFLTTRIGGQVYQKECRPLNSKAEDAVIAVSAAGSGQIQDGRAKVNIYVPDIDNGSGHPVPDWGRIQELSALGEPLVSVLNEFDTDYDFDLEKAPKDYLNHENRQHFVNISIKFNRVTFNT